jgi:hypothetical protein
MDDWTGDLLLKLVREAEKARHTGMVPRYPQLAALYSTLLSGFIWTLSGMPVASLELAAHAGPRSGRPGKMAPALSFYPARRLEQLSG